MAEQTNLDALSEHIRAILARAEVICFELERAYEIAESIHADHAIPLDVLSAELRRTRARAEAMATVVGIVRAYGCCDGEEAYRTAEMTEALAALDAAERGA